MTWKASRPRRPVYIPRYAVIASVATVYGSDQCLTPDSEGLIRAHFDIWVRDENGKTVLSIPRRRFKLYFDSDGSGLLELGDDVATLGGANHVTPDLTHGIYLYRLTFQHRPPVGSSPRGLRAVQYVLMVEPPLWTPKSSVSPGCAIISVPVYVP